MTAIGLPPLGRFFMILGTMTLFGLMISATYLYADKDRIPLQSYALTLVIMPAIVSVIIIMVGSNFASALSLGGAFAVLRFRSAASDPKDIVYILFCMAIGLTGGLGLLLYAFSLTVCICVVMFLLQRIHFAAPKQTHRVLKIMIPEDFNYHHAFDDIFKKYTSKVIHEKIRTTDLGSLIELTFELTLTDEVNEKDFIDEIRTRNGNLPVVLFLRVSQTVTGWY